MKVDVRAAQISIIRLVRDEKICSVEAYKEIIVIAIYYTVVGKDYKVPFWMELQNYCRVQEL